MRISRKMHMPVAKVVVGGLLTQPQSLRQLAQFGAATESIRLSIEEGNHEQGVQLIGQVQGLIDDVPTVAELFIRLQDEARRCQQNLPRF
jgi:enoyl-[acyl-carrier protein] reductase II